MCPLLVLSYRFWQKETTKIDENWPQNCNVMCLHMFPLVCLCIKIRKPSQLGAGSDYHQKVSKKGFATATGYISVKNASLYFGNWMIMRMVLVIAKIEGKAGSCCLVMMAITE